MRLLPPARTSSEDGRLTQQFQERFSRHLRNSFPGKVNHLLSDPPGDNVGGALTARGVGRKWLRVASAQRTRAGGQDRAARGLCLPHPCVHTPRHMHMQRHTHAKTHKHTRTEWSLALKGKPEAAVRLSVGTMACTLALGTRHFSQEFLGHPVSFYHLIGWALETASATGY